jgi:hypothetical protein
MPENAAKLLNSMEEIMNKKIRYLRTGLRLDIRKPPKTEIPKNVYTRKQKHKKGDYNENSNPLFIFAIIFLIRPKPACRTAPKCLYRNWRFYEYASI